MWKERLRFWFRGELVPLPAEQMASLADEETARLAAERERDAERAMRVALEAELARLRGAGGQPG